MITLVRALRKGAARGAGTVVVLGRAGREGETALARVVAAYAEGTGGYSAQARPTVPWTQDRGTGLGSRAYISAPAARPSGSLSALPVAMLRL